MQSNIKVSIIIPIYSVADYLPICIDSVLKQSYPNIEIILVDDGSPDNSANICDKYAESFPNVRVIHKLNGGLSDARNKGIEFATGDYIAFLDGDDFWDDTNALETLVRRVEKTNADVLNYSFKKYYEDTQEIIPYFQNVSAMPLEMTSKIEQLGYLSDNHLYISSACTKLIKKELFTKDLLFEIGVYSEDVEWSARLIKKARTMDFICENFYCYRQRRDSISHTINDKKSRDLCHHIIDCIKLSQSEGEEQEALAKYAAYQYGTYFIVQAQAENPQTECIRKLNEYSDILLYHQNNRKLTVLYWCTKLLGYKNVCRIIRFVYSIRK